MVRSLKGTKAKLADRVTCPAVRGQPISREDPVVEDEPGEELTLWLFMRLPDFIGQESRIAAQELGLIRRVGRVHTSGVPVPRDGVLSVRV